MRIEIVEEKGGYALPSLKASGVGGTVLEKPFVLLSGPNGSGKSALLSAIRSSIGVDGHRYGKPLVMGGWTGRKPEEIAATLDVEALGFAGQDTFMFDSRVVSAMPTAGALDTADMLHHAGMIACGAARVSHGEFVRRTWDEAIGWAVASVHPLEPPAPVPAKSKSGRMRMDRPLNRDHPDALAQRHRSRTVSTHPERWLLLDEPENAIDIERLVGGLCTILAACEIGRLRVLCSSHSLVFATGLARHPKVQVVDFLAGETETWMERQRAALDIVHDAGRVDAMGKVMTGAYRVR